MDFDMEKFSYRLNSLLDENNMTQTQLAQKIGTSNVTICRYLTCERIPRLDVITKIASVFGVTVDYLLGVSNDKILKNFNESSDLNVVSFIRKLFSLDAEANVSKAQVELIKKLLLDNKDFILSA